MKQENKTRSGSGRSGSGNTTKGRNENKNGSNGSQNGHESGTREKSGSTSEEASGQPNGKSQGSKLEKFFTDQLKDIYYAEQKIVQAIPEMQNACTTEELRDAFGEHLMQTRKHVKRLERVFEILGLKPEGKKCEAIEGIVKEAKEIIQETEEGTMTRDAALIMAAQKVEHYEIATYGGLVQFAITVGQHEAADILDRTLREEEDTDHVLTEIAENDINLGAEQEEIEFSWNRNKGPEKENKGQKKNTRMEMETE